MHKLTYLERHCYVVVYALPPCTYHPLWDKIGDGFLLSSDVFEPKINTLVLVSEGNPNDLNYNFCFKLPADTRALERSTKSHERNPQGTLVSDL